MTDFLKNLKQRRILENLFAPQTPLTSIATPPITRPINPPAAPMISMNSPLRTMSRATPSVDAYREYLGSEPRREDYQAGKVGKILAALAGFSQGIKGGPGAAYSMTRGIVDAPYQNALETHSRKGGRLKELAELEYRGMTDDQKLQVQIAEDELDRMKEFRAWVKDQADIKLTDAQIENLHNQAKARGLSVEKNDQTGEWFVVDKVNNKFEKIGKFGESIQEKDKREFNMFSKKYSVEQAGRKEMEGIRFGNDKTLAAMRRSWDREDTANEGSKISATQSNAAFDGALKEVALENRNLYNSLFDSDGQIKDEVEESEFDRFMDLVKLRRNKKLGRPTTPEKSYFKGSPTVTINSPSGEGEVPVIAPDGTPGTVPADELQEAIREGYRLR